MESVTGPNVEVTKDMFPCETWEKDGHILTVAPLWEMNDKVTFEDYLPDLNKNFRKAGRNYGCMRTVADEALIKCPDVLDIKATKRPHPFNADGTINTNILKPDIKADYFIHNDLSKNHDATGICMTHWCDRTEKVIIDFMLQKKPPRGGELKLKDARKFIFDLDKLGFDFYKATFDGWQSLDNIQVIKEYGILADVYSVDRTTQAYDTMIDLINDDMLDYYAHPVFLTELKGLRIFNKKYDHKRGFSKDVSDATAAAVFQCNKYRPKTDKEIDKESDKAENKSAEEK